MKIFSNLNVKIVIISILSSICIMLALAVRLFTSSNQQRNALSISTSHKTTIPTKNTISYAPLPTRSSKDLDLLTPQIYGDITIEYRPKSQTYVIYFQGEEDAAKEKFIDFMKKSGIDNLEKLKTFYVSLNPIASVESILKQK